MFNSLSTSHNKIIIFAISHTLFIILHLIIWCQIKANHTQHKPDGMFPSSQYPYARYCLDVVRRICFLVTSESERNQISNPHVCISIPAIYMHVNRNLHKKALTDGSAVTMTADDSSLPITAPFNEGVTYELCAGIIDKNMSLAGLMKQEILEECGYDIPEENLQEVVSFRGGVGSTGSLQTFFYAEVTDEMIVSQGGGNLNEGERIEVFYLPLDKSREFVFDATKHKPAGLMFAFMWYFNKFNI